MKTTMYELLGMVKDVKELPKKVKVLDVIYEFDDLNGDYFNKSLDRYLFVFMASEEEWKLSYFLNAQVEILEEEKNIPEKLEGYDFDDSLDANTKCECLRERMQEIENKLDEIIHYLNIKGE